MKKLRRIGKYIVMTTLSFVLLAIIPACIYMQHPEFGSTPSGIRLERIKQSPNYKDGKFQNATETPTFAEGHRFWGELRKSLFNKYPHRVPGEIIPSVKTDLTKLPIDSAVVIWFGHSSCFIQVNGKRILVDPVFSKNASPIPGSVKAFEGQQRILLPTCRKLIICLLLTITMTTWIMKQCWHYGTKQKK